ncbi:hypothetical protein ACKWTF_014608 [Chironomus riparius]
MTITKTAFIISVFNVVSCTAFFLYRFLIFYEIVELTQTNEINRFTVVSRREFNPNVTSYMDAEHGLIVEMSAYFLGILFNALLPLGVNTAREKVRNDCKFVDFAKVLCVFDDLLDLQI